MKASDHYLRMLSLLSKRAKESPKDLAPAVGIVNDVARLFLRGNPDDVRLVQAAVAAVREDLEGVDVVKSPTTELQSANSHSFLAGAMWVLDELATLRLDSWSDAPQARAVTRRAQVRELLLDLIGNDPVSPSDLRDRSAAKDLEVRADEISRALGALIQAGAVREVDLDPDADRRTKLYARSAGPDSL